MLWENTMFYVFRNKKLFSIFFSNMSFFFFLKTENSLCKQLPNIPKKLSDLILKNHEIQTFLKYMKSPNRILKSKKLEIESQNP